MDRRHFLKSATAGAAALSASGWWRDAAEGSRPVVADSEGYRYRIAFGAWINDMRRTPLPLENWPAPQLDDEAIESAIAALDVQAEAGMNMLDVWGLFATYGWPVDIVSAVDADRRRRIRRLLKAADERGIVPVLGLGTYSWGYDKIIEADPEVRGKDPDGTPHAHAMCDANPRAFDYVRRIIDFALGEFEFGGVHLESCDLGCCMCPSCAGHDGVVGYNVRINQKAADYIRQHWPEKTVYVITINWLPAGQHFDAEQKAHLVDLSGHVDCIFDQGHNGYHIDPAQRRAFIAGLKCAYGTSGQVWLYPDTKWDRASYFLPYPQRSGAALRAQFDDGVRGCMYYQGPVTNPGQEFMMAFGGRMLSDPSRDVDDVAAEVLERLYRPRGAESARLLARVFRTAEDSYFAQWREEPFRKTWGIPVPGEFKLDARLFGAVPGPATYLKEPCLDAAGRAEYRKGLCAVIQDVDALEGRCRDEGRLDRIRRAAITTLNMLSTISYCVGEPIE